MFRGFALLFAILFLWAALVQWNDPDAWVWYLIYGMASLASFLFFFDRLSFGVAVFLALGYLIGLPFLWPQKFEGFTIGEGDIGNIERGREVFGLLINAVVMIVFALRIRFTRRSKL